MSFLGINIAGSALAAFQQAENVTAQNIANVQTPGASRQIVNLGQLPPIDGSPGYPTSLVPGTQGTGVFVSSISRVHQDSYDALFRGASASQQFFDAQESILRGLETAAGEPHYGVNTAYTAFQSSLQTLVSNPSGIAERTGVLNAAQGLVTTLNRTANAITASQTQTQSQAVTVVTTINATLDAIAGLNGQIRAATAVGDSPNTYADQRDRLIDTLSTYVNTATSVQADGSTLVTIGGLAVVNDTVTYHLAPPFVGTAPDGTPALQVRFVTPPTSVTPPAIAVTSGRLGGLLDCYNTMLLPYAQQLNNFAGALASEADRFSQAGYDVTGQRGAQLFSPVVTQLAVGAGNIRVGITTAAEFPAGLATTAAGTLVQALNAGNSVVDTTAALNGNATLRNPPAGALTGTLTVAVDGITQTFAYATGAGGNAATINGFINAFNAAHTGVSAAFDASAQTIVFARDPANIDLVHRAAMAAALPPGTTTPDFMLSDSNGPQATPLVSGAAATSLLAALGANAIDGVGQTATNALGVTSGANANAMLALCSATFGAPPLQTTAVTAVVAGLATIAAPPSSPPAFAQLRVGDVLTLDAGSANQENVTIVAVDRNAGTISFIAKHPHAAGMAVTSAQIATLQQTYAGLVAHMAIDTSTAMSANAAQATLTSNIDTVRQSVDGINIDEETQNLIKFQNAYGASAHVMAILSKMLEEAIHLGGGSY
jgi:flagellar hook-associated protein 1 FlgK